MVQKATDADLDGVRDVFLALYSPDDPSDTCFDPQWLRGSVYTDDILMVVTQCADTGQIIWSASMVWDIGSHSDRIGGVGRLVVQPPFRGCGIGRKRLAGRVSHIQHRLYKGIVEHR